MPKKQLAVMSSGIWIAFSEFIRNEFLLKKYWVDHFQGLGLEFETLPVNGTLWLIWSFILAYLIYKLLQKFTLKETIALSWLAAFVMMWITIYNLQALPLSILIFAIPLSLFEVYVAGLIINKIK